MIQIRLIDEKTKSYALEMLGKSPVAAGLQVVISEEPKSITARMRNWFHVVLDIIERQGETGYTKKELKDIIKYRAFGLEEVSLFGVLTPQLKSSEDCGRREYSQLIEEAYKLANFIGCILPEPDPEFRKK